MLFYCKQSRTAGTGQVKGLWGKTVGYDKLMKVLIEYKMLLIQVHDNDNLGKLGKLQGTFSRFLTAIRA